MFSSQGTNPWTLAAAALFSVLLLGVLTADIHEAPIPELIQIVLVSIGVAILVLRYNPRIDLSEVLPTWMIVVYLVLAATSWVIGLAMGWAS